MAPPKKRVRVVISDDEEEPEDQPLKAQDKTSKATARRSARLSSKPPQPQQTSSIHVDDGDDDPGPPAISKKSTSKGKSAAPKPTRKATPVLNSPSKPSPRTSPLKAQRPNASIKSFFGSSQPGQFSLSQRSDTRVTKKPQNRPGTISSGLDRLILSQGSTVPFIDDQIEDSSEDDGTLNLRNLGSSSNGVVPDIDKPGGSEAEDVCGM